MRFKNFRAENFRFPTKTFEIFEVNVFDLGVKTFELFISNIVYSKTLELFFDGQSKTSATNTKLAVKISNSRPEMKLVHSRHEAD